MPVLATNLGFPRMGAQRELKRALESFWSGKVPASHLHATATDLRARHWTLQSELGIDHIPVGDFSLYDHVLDAAVQVGAAAPRHRVEGTDPLERYFAMARGGRLGDGQVTALEMTKWFDTNYHYLVPELASDQAFSLHPERILGELAEARAHSIPGLAAAARPVLVGPVTLLTLSKVEGHHEQRLGLLPALCEVYADLLRQLSAAGATWVQIDEPVLVLDPSPEVLDSTAAAYATLAAAAPDLRILLATYFAGFSGDDSALGAVVRLPVAAIHLDLVSDPGQLDLALAAVAALDAPAPEGPALALSLGVVDGRNVWRSDLAPILTTLEPALDILGPDRLMVGPSCSLLHLPVDLALEPSLPPDLRGRLAFATQRLEEIALLVRGLNEGRSAIASELAATPPVVPRPAPASLPMSRRRSPYPVRRAAQQAVLGLPALPTTSIGSFPQTPELRALRAEERRGAISEESYRRGLQRYIEGAIAFQEGVGLDVLVHGEPERTDMVEYFAELLDGFAVTAHGWVQSYGSRCVKPPILHGYVARPRPMTVEWITYAASLTDRPVKGMLTGPITILKWSFVRCDQPIEESAREVALAIRDEVADLEAAGVRVIQIDEPAFREGLPLRRAEREHYLEWATEAFWLASDGASDETQIHTHMCYAEFNEVMDAIAAFDADVISIEASRSGMELLSAFAEHEYPNDVGPGVWDIHSPRVPSTDEMVDLLERALQVVPADRLWVNPDCGLKTRRWEEVEAALANMAEAAEIVRRRDGRAPA